MNDALHRAVAAHKSHTLIAPQAYYLKPGDLLLNDPAVPAGESNRLLDVFIVPPYGVMLITEKAEPRSIPGGSADLLVERASS